MGTVVAVAASVVVPRVASAQTGDAGVTVVPAFVQYLDTPPVCCPASFWVALGCGPRFRLQVDYVQSSRRSEGYGGYPHDELIDGRMASTRRDSFTRRPCAISTSLPFGAFSSETMPRSAFCSVPACDTRAGPIAPPSPAPASASRRPRSTTRTTSCSTPG